MSAIHVLFLIGFIISVDAFAQTPKVPDTPVYLKAKKKLKGGLTKAVDPSVVQANRRLGLLIYTPLIKENIFDKRFRALGLQPLITLPISEITNNSNLQIETGVAMTIARVTLIQPATKFTHIFFAIPIRIQLNWVLTPSLELGTFFGAIFKIFEYDSRPTEDGGFFTISGFFDEIDPDGGVLVTYSVSKNLWLSVEIGYIFLAAGVRIPF